MMEDVCTAFALIADLCLALGIENISVTCPNCQELQVDEHWWIAVNPHKEVKQTSGGVTVEPYTCYVEFNGWPAGTFTPFGGVIAAGELANEDSFISALQGRLAKEMK